MSSVSPVCSQSVQMCSRSSLVDWAAPCSVPPISPWLFYHETLTVQWDPQHFLPRKLKGWTKSNTWHGLGDLQCEWHTRWSAKSTEPVFDWQQRPKITQEEWEQRIHYTYSKSHSQILNKCTSVISEDESKAHACPWSSYYPFVLGLYPKYCCCRFCGTFSAGDLGKICHMKLKTRVWASSYHVPPRTPSPLHKWQWRADALSPTQDAPGDSMKDHVGKIVLLRPSDSLPHLSYTSGVSSPYRSPSPWVNSFFSARLDGSWAEKPWDIGKDTGNAWSQRPVRPRHCRSCKPVACSLPADKTQHWKEQSAATGSIFPTTSIRETVVSNV